MTETISLGQIAHARSGDKGGHANIGVIAFTPAGFAYLKSVLTATAVAEFFAGLQPSHVERFELEGIHALNFLLRDVLQGGASQSLRTDSQGKVLGVAILEMPIPVPVQLASMIASNNSLD